MRHESNWLEYIHKLANDRQDSSLQVKQRAHELHSHASHAQRSRDEWLQAGYPAQMSLPFRAGR
ncbi:MAG TPA: hypothetical protein VG962_00540 [Steroidobacteraceae bacterium]|nr:hypothetical protein [Steroidobacteraceae bacterium]